MSDMERMIKVYNPTAQSYKAFGNQRFASTVSLREVVGCSPEAVLSFLDVDGDWMQIEDQFINDALPQPLKLKWTTGTTGFNAQDRPLPEGVVEINVGGSLFQCSRASAERSSLLSTGLGDADRMFVDRDAATFPLVLAYLRSSADHPDVQPSNVVAFLEEAAYYLLNFSPRLVVNCRFKAHVPFYTKDPRQVFRDFATSDGCGGEVFWTGKEVLEGTLTVAVISGFHVLRDLFTFLRDQRAEVLDTTLGMADTLSFRLPATLKAHKTSRSPLRQSRANSDVSSLLGDFEPPYSFDVLTHTQVVAWLQVTELSDLRVLFERHQIEGHQLAGLMDDSNDLFGAIWANGEQVAAFGRLLKLLHREVREGFFTEDEEILDGGRLLSFGVAPADAREESADE